MWKTKTDLYRKYNSNVLVIPSLFPPVVTILIADAQVSFFSNPFVSLFVMLD